MFLFERNGGKNSSWKPANTGLPRKWLLKQGVHVQENERFSQIFNTVRWATRQAPSGPAYETTRSIYLKGPLWETTPTRCNSENEGQLHSYTRFLRNRM